MVTVHYHFSFLHEIIQIIDIIVVVSTSIANELMNNMRYEGEDTHDPF